MFSNNEDNRYKISPELRESIIRYGKDKIETGSFLRAVLENDLTEAMKRADSQNCYSIFDIVEYIFWEVPYNIWGSKEKVAKWLGE